MATMHDYSKRELIYPSRDMGGVVICTEKPKPIIWGNTTQKSGVKKYFWRSFDTLAQAYKERSSITDWNKVLSFWAGNITQKTFARAVQKKTGVKKLHY